MEIKELNFLLTKDIRINFCTCHLAHSICHACNDRMSKMPVIEKIIAHLKLNMVCVGACGFNRRPFLGKACSFIKKKIQSLRKVYYPF